MLDQLLEKLCWEEWECPGFPAGLGFSGWLLFFPGFFSKQKHLELRFSPLSALFVFSHCLFLPFSIADPPLASPMEVFIHKKKPKRKLWEQLWDLFLTKLKEKSLEKLNKRLFMT